MSTSKANTMPILKSLAIDDLDYAYPTIRDWERYANRTAGLSFRKGWKSARKGNFKPVGLWRSAEWHKGYDMARMTNALIRQLAVRPGARGVKPFEQQAAEVVS